MTLKGAVTAPLLINRRFFQALNLASSDTLPLSKLLYPFRSHLFFEIGANVLPGGERHHLTILVSALRQAVIFAPIKNSPKVGANLAGLRLSYESPRPPFV
jgi:hypothetical protein